MPPKKLKAPPGAPGAPLRIIKQRQFLHCLVHMGHMYAFPPVGQVFIQSMFRRILRSVFDVLEELRLDTDELLDGEGVLPLPLLWTLPTEERLGDPSSVGVFRSGDGGISSVKKLAWVGHNVITWCGLSRPAVYG